MEKDFIPTTKEEVERLCALYQWLNLFVEEVSQKENYELWLQQEENKRFPNRFDDLGRIHQELDLYRSFSLTWWNSLSKRQRRLQAKIEKEIHPKHRNDLTVHEAKVDTCEFKLRLDNPSTGNMITSYLYTVYPEVRDRIHNQLEMVLQDTNDDKIKDLITSVLYNKKEKFTKKVKCKRMEEYRKDQLRTHDN